MGSAARIFDIQGPGRSSPLAGKSVSTWGIVTALCKSGFYLQDPQGDGNDATSDAVFVFTGPNPANVRPGDSVKVQATVTEFVRRDAEAHFTSTQLTQATIEVLSRGNALPAPVLIGPGGRLPPNGTIDKAIDFFDSLDGMRVRVASGTGIGPNARAPSFALLADGVEAQPRTRRGGLALSPAAQNPARLQVRLDPTALPGFAAQVDVGAHVANLVGVMRYQFGGYQLTATEPFQVTRPARLPPDVTRLVSTAESMTIGWFNIENFDPKLESPERIDPKAKPDDDIGSGKAALLGKHVVDNLRAPDVIGLAEVQDSDGIELGSEVSAARTYEALIEAIVAAGGPRYAWADLPPAPGADGGEPGGNIRVGFLYRPDRVQLDRKSLRRIGDGHPAFERSRKSLEAVFTKNGARVTVVANHFASKRGSTPLFGTKPPSNGGEGARCQQGDVIRRHVESKLAREPKAKVVVVGDFNEVEHNEPMRRLAGRTLVNLIERVPQAERYTYNFEGHSQAIDHGLVPAHMADSSELDIVHLNADFATRSSDHDAFVMRVALR